MSLERYYRQSLPIKGRVARARWGNRGCLQRRADRTHHAFEILANIAVPKSQDPEAFADQHAIADGVVRGLLSGAVTLAIHLDDQASREADEVEVVAAERGLTAKLVAFCAKSLQPRPEDDFGFVCLDSRNPENTFGSARLKS